MSIQVKSIHVKSSQIMSRQVISSQIKSRQVLSSSGKSSQAKSSQVKQSQVNSSQVKVSQVKSRHVNSSQVKTCQFKSSHVKFSNLTLGLRTVLYLREIISLYCFPGKECCFIIHLWQVLLILQCFYTNPKIYSLWKEKHQYFSVKLYFLYNMSFLVLK